MYPKPLTTVVVSNTEEVLVSEEEYQKRRKTSLAIPPDLDLVGIQDWKKFYKESKKIPNCSGYFLGKFSVTSQELTLLGDYGTHGKEIIKVTQVGYYVTALKITGDVNVPAGQETWVAFLDTTGTKGKGRIHLADVGFKKPRWGLLTVEISEDNNSIDAVWYMKNLVCNSICD